MAHVGLTEAAFNEELSSISTLSPSGSKARFGLAYMRAICSQAGVGLNETSPDEDALAVDCDVCFSIAPVRVQVKCTSQFELHGKSASWPIEIAWREKWNKSKIPVYLVLVILSYDERKQWLEHPKNGTFHNAAAFWVRVNNLPAGETRLDIPKNQRLTAETLQVWESDLEACFYGLG
ncbi:DUF4365 domain-containing protein [Streptosporangium sp. NPDC051023]|uniref:DUF4365 domain-containing protein n=1 Tax=Streptosporangium sp. NPDC051023 TaxID=3155410 RepID=UPI00344E556C